MAIRKELSLLNQSAVNSLDEGLQETLTLHRLTTRLILNEVGGMLKEKDRRLLGGCVSGGGHGTGGSLSPPEVSVLKSA